MNKVSQKKNASSMQVLKTLQILLQGNFTMQELITKLNENEKEAVFNNSVISKYINTCRYCGMDVPKIHNMYFVTSMPFGLNLTTSDADLIEKLMSSVKDNMGSKQLKIFSSLVEKINRYSNKKIARVDKNRNEEPFELFEKAVTDKRKVKLLLKSRVNIEGIPLNIIDNKGKTFFHLFSKNRERMIDSDRLSGIEILNEKFIGKFSDQSTVFVLKGDLAKRYQIRENEKLLEKHDESIVISNRGENKEVLFARLLRYDDKCEIINPKAYREEFCQILNSTLANYGVN